MFNFGNLKSDLREVIFPSGEATSLVKAHDKMFLDALIDLQTWVECLQQDNTSLIPQCATFYKCGLTVFDAPRGRIKKLSVIDKVDPVTGYESLTGGDDWCSEVKYSQIDFCHVRKFIDINGSCCLGSYFGLNPNLCCKGYPTPTDEGLPAGLAPLPLGFHYAQNSTDSVSGPVPAVDEEEVVTTPVAATAVQQVWRYPGDPNGHIPDAPSKYSVLPMICIDTLTGVTWVKDDGIASSTGWH